MNRHKLAFSLIGIFIVQLSYAGYFKHIGREEGLSQSSVMAIYQVECGLVHVKESTSTIVIRWPFIRHGYKTEIDRIRKS